MNSWRSQSPRSNELGSKPNCVTAVDNLTSWPTYEACRFRPSRVEETISPRKKEITITPGSAGFLA